MACRRRAIWYSTYVPAQPNYVPEFKALSGKNQRVARYVRSFPQTSEFLKPSSDETWWGSCCRTS